MCKRSFRTLTERPDQSSGRVRHFYAALLTLSLILGKIVTAQAQREPLIAPKLVVVTAMTSPASAGASTAGSLSTTTAANPLQLTSSDKDLLAARIAFEKRDLNTLATLKDRKGKSSEPANPLAPYPQYWWLSTSLSLAASFGVANASEIRAFLSANPNSVVAEGLRREWLKTLGKSDEWTLFSAEIPLLNSDDTEITCHNWRYRLGRNERDTLTEAKAFWNTARPAPDACDEVFARLAAEKMLLAADTWARVRTLLENNQLTEARKSAAMVPGIPANFERFTAEVGQNPAQYLQREKLQPTSRSSVELFLFAVTRLARNDAERAASLLDAQGKKLAANDFAYAWAQVGLYGAMQHNQDALAWFGKAESQPLNDIQAAWKARAALRAGDWANVRAAINAMSDAERRESAWRYWLARASQATGNVETALALRNSLARENNFYGVLAAEELGAPQIPQWQGWKPTRAAIDMVTQRPAISRALALYRLDMKTEGLREWLHGIRDMDDQELLAAAEAARLANVPDRAINTAEKTLMVHDFSQRFPTPHQSDLSSQAKAQGLDEAWVYGLIRQESRFMADAKSRAGAMGLMQLMPATATWAAKKVGMDRFSLARVVDVPVNLSLGSFYLRHVLDDLGHPVLATAGYNAGPGRARRWRGLLPLEGAIYAESIPFNETRDYVKKVMVNAWFYAHQSGATTRRLKEMMGTVPGRSDGSRGMSSLASAAIGSKTQ